MKNLFLILIVALCLIGGCKSDNTSSTGNVTFWNYNTNIGNITVRMDGATSTITLDQIPSNCSTSGCANIYDAPGTYAWSAVATTGQTWSGYATITSGGCLLYQLQ